MNQDLLVSKLEELEWSSLALSALGLVNGEGFVGKGKKEQALQPVPGGAHEGFVCMYVCVYMCVCIVHCAAVERVTCEYEHACVPMCFCVYLYEHVCVYVCTCGVFECLMNMHYV